MVYRVVVFDDDMSQCEIIKNMIDRCDEYEERKYNIICECARKILCRI